MRSLAWALLLCLVLLLTSGREPSRRVINVSTAEELIVAVSRPLAYATIRLAPGRYVLPRIDGEALAWRACPDPYPLPATFGVVIAGHSVRLEGPASGEAIIESDADFRIRLNECSDCVVERVTVTGNNSRNM